VQTILAKRRKTAGTKKGKVALSDNAFFVLTILVVIAMMVFFWWRLIY